MKTMMIAISIFLMLTHSYVHAYSFEHNGRNIDTKNVIILEQIDNFELESFKIKALKFSEQNKPIVIVFDSIGGEVEAGKKIIKILEWIQNNKEVYCVVKRAISMGFNILSHCDRRIGKYDAEYMFHDIYLISFPKDIRLTAKNLRKQANNIEADNRPINQYNAEKLNMSIEEYEHHSDNETYWTSEQLFARKYLHSVIK